MDQQHIHLAINDALRAYCRGIDRLDREALASAFHPGAALIDYGPEPTTIEAFVERAVTSLGKRFVATQHRLSNVSIEIDPSQSTAKVESYVLAFHVETDGTTERLHTFNGRYIDRFEEREGGWKIARRTLRNDWSKVETIDTTMSGSWVRGSRSGSTDPHKE